MIKEFIAAFETHRAELEAGLRAAHPEDYTDLVRRVVSILPPDEKHDRPDSTRIHKIDDGDYQGTLVFVIGAAGYQPSTYWSVMISYGSCSGCDTFERIKEYSYDLPTDEQVKDYMTLMLHIVQRLTRLHNDLV